MRQCPEVILNKIFINVFAHWSATVVICRRKQNANEEEEEENDKASIAVYKQREHDNETFYTLCRAIKQNTTGGISCSIWRDPRHTKILCAKLNWNKCEQGNGKVKWGKSTKLGRATPYWKAALEI